MSARFFDLAQPFLAAGLLTPADVHTVALVAGRFGETDPTRMLGLAFAVRAPRVGHAGVELGLLPAKIDAERLLHAGRRIDPPSEEEAALAEAASEVDSENDAAEVAQSGPASAAGAAPESEVVELVWPDLATWHATTLASPMVGGPERHELPFVRQELGNGSLLLTRRMYREQELVANAVRRRAAQLVPDHARVDDLDARLAALFPGEADCEAACAVRLAASRRLSIVIGGPGTGKTFSITRLLAALLASDRGERPLVIKLAAPTGKAAVRMREAIREATDAGAIPHLAVDERVRVALQELEASTLHRLLGVRPDGSTRHGPDNPLPADVVVVDEVSMIDLTQMRRLVEAVHEDARLVLLGDRDQLASVEAGCVLADLVNNGTQGILAENVQVFTRSRRFSSAPDIALIAACLQSYATSMEGVPTDPDARVQHAVNVFVGRAHAEGEHHREERVTHLGAPEAPRAGQRPRPSDAQLDALALPYTAGFDRLEADGGTSRLPGYAALLLQHRLASGRYSTSAQDPAVQRALLDALDHYRVLAVHRRGPLGVSGLGDALAKRVRKFLSPDGASDGRRHWIGRPILVTENAYDVGLMNGDVGLVLPTVSGLAAVFPHERRGEVRAVALSRLPPHDGALAMTVHKSQGSQFDRVALVLAGRPSPIQTRELVYTGVTRAKNRLVWLGTEGELRDALKLRVERASGLEALLG